MDEFGDLTREELVGLLRQMAERIACLEKENEALRSQLPRGGDGAHAPPFVRPGRKPRSAEPRKKRGKWFGRRLEEATEEIEHVTGERCPDCGGLLSKPWEHARRQVMEIPESRIRVIDHVIMAQRCGYCGKVHHAKLSVSDGVIGKHRFGVRLMSLVTTLSTANRIPVRMIQQVLRSLYGVRISAGEIVEIMHKVAHFGESEKEKILEEIRGSPVTCNDETSWREDGANGYLWCVATEDARYYHRDKSRGQDVSKSILGEGYEGTLSADFYGGYNWYDGPIQRCWSHLKRDLDALMEKHTEDAGVKEFADSALAVYRLGKRIARALEIGKIPASKRLALASALEEQLLKIARPWLRRKESPQHVLSKRIERHGGEFFTFVRYEGVPSSNNAAERAIRPAVTARKISGGTRSPKGSETKSTLMTLFGTWALRKADLLTECHRMLTQSCHTHKTSPG
jgi:transposase